MIEDFPLVVVVIRVSTLCFGITALADAVAYHGHWASLLAGVVSLTVFVVTLGRHES